MMTCDIACIYKLLTANREKNKTSTYTAYQTKFILDEPVRMPSILAFFIDDSSSLIYECMLNSPENLPSIRFKSSYVGQLFKNECVIKLEMSSGKTQETILKEWEEQWLSLYEKDPLPGRPQNWESKISELRYGRKALGSNNRVTQQEGGRNTFNLKKTLQRI